MQPRCCLLRLGCRPCSHRDLPLLLHRWCRRACVRGANAQHALALAAGAAPAPASAPAPALALALAAAGSPASPRAPAAPAVAVAAAATAGAGARAGAGAARRLPENAFRRAQLHLLAPGLPLPALQIRTCRGKDVSRQAGVFKAGAGVLCWLEQRRNRLKRHNEKGAHSALGW